MQFCMENLKLKRKRTIFFDLQEREFEPQIFSNFCALDLNLRVTRSKLGNLLKEIGLYYILTNDQLTSLLIIHKLKLCFKTQSFKTNVFLFLILEKRFVLKQSSKEIHSFASLCNAISYIFTSSNPFFRQMQAGLLMSDDIGSGSI